MHNKKFCEFTLKYKVLLKNYENTFTQNLALGGYFAHR